MNFERGSEWRKWDLHVHTPASILNNQFSSDWDQYIHELFTKAIAQNIAVIGITDYYSIEGYKKIKRDYIENENKLKIIFATELETDPEYLDKIKSIKLLPNIEFRFKDIILSGDKSQKIEGHIIFSDELSIEDIEENFLIKVTFLDKIKLGSTDKTPLTKSNIEKFGKRMKEEQPTFTDSDYVVGLNCLVVDFEDIEEILENSSSSTFANKYVVIIPEDDITKINWSSGAHQVRKKYYVKANGFFSVNEKTIQWGLREETKKEFGTYKPCFSCSDAHSIDDLFKFKSNKCCWIKADPTFEGLLQVFFLPMKRIFLGTMPPKLDKVNREKYYYLDEISIEKNIKAKNETNWFNARIPLNSGLIAIIGNKGSGKSALADIIGYLVDSKNQKFSSFLNNQRFRKEDKKYANDYQARLTWKDGRNVFKPTLNESTGDVQTAEYLPQKYIDELCNELNDAFQNEIDSVIFSYIDNSEKMEALTLKELLSKKTQDIEFQIQSYKNKIETQIKLIIGLEKKLTTTYKNELEETLKKQEEYLESHQHSKPKEVVKPTKSSSAIDLLDGLNKKLDEIEGKIKAARDQVLSLNLKIEALKQFIGKYKFLETQVKELYSEAQKLALENGILDDLDIRLNGNIDIFISHLSKLEKDKENLVDILDEHPDVEADDTHRLLLVEKRSVDNEIRGLLLAAEDADVKYQQYLSNKKQWEDTQQSIIGNKTTEGSIEFCKAELAYLQTGIHDDLDKAQKELMELIKEIYQLYIKKSDVYKSVYEPIEEKLKLILKDNTDKIDFQTVLKLNKEFNATFLGFIRQNVDSIYKGKAEGIAAIDKIVRECDFRSWKGFELFIQRLFASISSEKDKIEKLLTNVEACYNYIAKLEYLDVIFSLKMDGKTLEELSPGQRGNVLLVFYLALSKKSEPIIIDQPEDNLDNQSVYNKLVPCILEAKRNRQVIIVTHNPNIAVACDAEQIICAQIDKTTNAISYKSGSIESPEIKRAVIDILEGTMPAFDLRRIKYSSHF